MEGCFEQLALAEVVLRAARLKSQLENEYDHARNCSHSNAEALGSAYEMARSQKNEAEEALKKHLKEHHCAPAFQWMVHSR